MYVRRLHPGISFDTARALIAEHAADPARLQDLSGRIMAFRLSCCFERLKRVGLPAQDADRRVFCYANADLCKDQQNDEILQFVSFWEQRTGRPPRS